MKKISNDDDHDINDENDDNDDNDDDHRKSKVRLKQKRKLRLLSCMFNVGFSLLIYEKLISVAWKDESVRCPH